VTWGTINSFTLVAIPMFILMAEILQVSGVGTRFYQGLAVLVRRLPGQLLQTNIAGCAMFSAISGSSVATSAAMGSVALPQLEEGGYDQSLAAGSLAAGGTLGILIPPSIPLIIYGTFTEVSITKLFAAGMIPGILLALVFMAYVLVVALIRPVRDARKGIGTEAPASLADILRAMASLAPLVALMVVVLGSMYGGFATPSEAAGLGCFMAWIVAKVWGTLSLRDLHVAMVRCVKVSTSILYIVLMAFVFSYAVENASLSTNLTRAIVGMDLGPYGFLLAVVLLFIALGCILESIAMIVLTIPLLFGPLISLGFDPLWFGVMLVLLLEVGMLTPPFGMNLFIVQGVSKWPMGVIIRGVVPYWILIFMFLGLLVVFPEIVTWLPSRLSS
jgi:tripartite ATP-independent transporter DctM subunit